MRGYQADLEAGAQWTGALFEHERGGLALRGEKAVIAADGTKQVTRFADAAVLQKGFRSNDWNEVPRHRARAGGSTVHQRGEDRACRGLAGGPGRRARAWAADAPRAADEGAVPERAAKGVWRRRLLDPGGTIDRAGGLQGGATLLAGPGDGGFVGQPVRGCEGRLIASGQYDEGLFRITPPPPGGIDADPHREASRRAQQRAGLAWAFDSLYALVSKNAKTPSGLYRVRDTDGDDHLDKVELLRALEGGGDHGWHAILPGPDGKSLYAVAGNNTKAPPLSAARVPPHWSEDHLLPRLPDAGGHMKGVLAPGGVIYRVSPDGRDWEMIANGFRNTYDAAFNAAGELFTYDADMEWDLIRRGIGPRAFVTSRAARNSAGATALASGRRTRPTACRPRSTSGPARRRASRSVTGRTFPCAVSRRALRGGLDLRPHLRRAFAARRCVLPRRERGVRLRRAAAGRGRGRASDRRRALLHHGRLADSDRAVPCHVDRLDAG